MNILKGFLLFAFSLVSISSQSAEHVVEGLTTGGNGEMILFAPGYLKVSVGNTVTFKPSDASHNTESLFSPSKDASFNTELGNITSIKMSQEGVYLHKCTPHFTLGMVGVIQVGNPSNEQEAIAVWKSMAEMIAMNKGRMEEYLEQIN